MTVFLKYDSPFPSPLKKSCRKQKTEQLKWYNRHNETEKEQKRYVYEITQGKYEHETATMKSAEIALNLLSLGAMSYEEIANATGLTLDDVKELAEQQA